MNWITRLSPRWLVILTFVLPPIITYWYYVVGTFVYSKNKKNVLLYKTLAISTVIIHIGTFAAVITLKIMTNKPGEYFFYLGLGFQLSMVITALACAKEMLRYEEEQSGKYEVGALKIRAILIRTFQLIYFPLAIFWLQQIVNKYDGENTHA